MVVTLRSNNWVTKSAFCFCLNKYNNNFNQDKDVLIIERLKEDEWTDEVSPKKRRKDEPACDTLKAQQQAKSPQ